MEARCSEDPFIEDDDAGTKGDPRDDIDRWMDSVGD